MRIQLAQALATRLRAAASAEASALTVWAATWDQAVPRVVVGYERPRTAQEWPFLGLLPIAGDWDLVHQLVAKATVALVCGVRDGLPVTDGERGVALVTALEEAVLSDLCQGGQTYAAGSGRLLLLETATQVDLEASYPHYVLESHLDLGRV